MVYTLYVRPSSHSLFFNWGEKIQTIFPNWFQEWWLFLGAIQNIFCPKIRKSFDYFKANCESFFPLGNSYSLSFCSQFRIPWILCWEFTSHNFLPAPFPQHLAREFKIKWWAAFKISPSQAFESIKDWLDSQKPKSKKPTKTKYPFGLNLCQAQSLGPKLRPKSHFLQIMNIRPISKGPKRKLQKPCPNLQTQMIRKKTHPPVLHSSKMKTCVMDSHTLPLSNGTSRSLVKSIYLRELKGSKFSKFQPLQITVDRFIEAAKEEIKQGSKWIDDSKLDRLARLSKIM